MNHKRLCYMVRPADGIEPTTKGWAAPRSAHCTKCTSDGKISWAMWSLAMEKIGDWKKVEILVQNQSF